MAQYVNNLEEEIRSDTLVTKETKIVWNIQIKMALKFLEVCQKHNLKAWCVSGAMLGAVRHKGFIPWDDDIDFFIFREDYDKLQKIASDEFKFPYFFQSPYTEEGYYRGHSQLRYDGTAMILPYEPAVGCKFHQGIFMDIFVADGFPEDEKERETLVYQRDTILDFLWNRKYPLRWLSSPYNLYAYIKSPFVLGKKIFWSDIKLYSYLEDLHRTYAVKGRQRNCCILFGYKPRWVRKNEWFDETAWLPFEKTMIPVPARYHEALTQEYGDYMKPVKGASCHGSVILDTDRSYTEYLSKLKMSVPHALYLFVRSCAGIILRKLGLRKKRQ